MKKYTRNTDPAISKCSDEFYIGINIKEKDRFDYLRLADTSYPDQFIYCTADQMIRDLDNCFGNTVRKLRIQGAIDTDVTGYIRSIVINDMLKVFLVMS